MQLGVNALAYPNEEGRHKNKMDEAWGEIQTIRADKDQD